MGASVLSPLVALLTCLPVEYHNIAPGTEREIFQRVQLGVTLTAAGERPNQSGPGSRIQNRFVF